MNKLRNILEGFDYIYFWLIKIHRNSKDKKEICIFLITIFQGSMLVIISYIILEHMFGHTFVHENLNTLKIVSVPIALVLLLINFNRYSNKYDEIIKKWETQTEFKETIGSILVVITLLMPLFILLIDMKLR